MGLRKKWIFLAGFFSFATAATACCNDDAPPLNSAGNPNGSPTDTPTLTPPRSPATGTEDALPPEIIKSVADCPLANKDYNNTRATNNVEINSGNVHDLGVKCSTVYNRKNPENTALQCS